jgi:predicted RNA-binding Zn-ribbon protein involved in translation (DUF1610 family)
MNKRCNLCAKKLNEQDKCTNLNCPNCIKEQIISVIEEKKKEGTNNA